jgi:hypothetical protein
MMHRSFLEVRYENFHVYREDVIDVQLHVHVVGASFEYLLIKRTLLILKRIIRSL